MDFARTVTMFLMDGAPKGRIKCSFDNWVGKVFLIPRTELKRSEERSEPSQTGIYLLFGTDPQTGEEQVYGPGEYIAMGATHQAIRSSPKKPSRLR